MGSTWFVRGGGKVYGPIDAGRLKRLVLEGKINRETEVAVNTGGPWHPAGSVRGLFAESASNGQEVITQEQHERDKPRRPDNATGSPVGDTSGAARIAHKDTAGESFVTWYRRTCGSWNIAFQILAWLFGGYVLIPSWWAFSSNASVKVRRIALSLAASVLGIIAFSQIGMAIAGKVPTSVVVTNRQVDFAREGNRILLNELEAKDNRHVLKGNRAASSAERITFAIVGGICAAVSAFTAIKAIRLSAYRVAGASE